ncbi:hypothetical protein Desde_1933 [Desulfitobacterium dehalogenans ATCC 51507]|uniref:Uncharacterized protein n=1 Tax=Desulfitobacterium dehalogenans (strain ATCC 51507 / DSM 9161 / JW/IU-DC1) TaxID=756499 RepID=I4A8N7_DESDJ|nr:hypothetical protein Desde_1933 [Desulfitobacterium dehalogenans ATCC 51507]
MCRCRLYVPVEVGAKGNCANCSRWTGKKCRDEAELLAREQKKHGWADRMMRKNLGIYLEYKEYPSFLTK